jgi:hypothetical protein
MTKLGFILATFIPMILLRTMQHGIGENNAMFVVDQIHDTLMHSDNLDFGTLFGSIG